MGIETYDSGAASFLLKQFLNVCGPTVSTEAGFPPAPDSWSRQAGNSKLSEMDT